MTLQIVQQRDVLLQLVDSLTTHGLLTRDRTMLISHEIAPCALVTIGLFDGGCNSITATANVDSIVYILSRKDFDCVCARARSPKAAMELL